MSSLNREPQIRLLSEGDLPMLMAIEVQSHSHPWSEGNFRDCLVTAGHECWGVWIGVQLSGYGILLKQLDEIHLLNICVAPRKRRAGLGSLLLSFLIERAAVMGGQSTWLEVRASNVSAQSLYRQYGFVEQGRRKGYYSTVSGREDAVLMALMMTVDDVQEYPWS